MMWIYSAWVAAGIVLGVFHATGVWRSAKRPSSWTALLGLARLLAVGLVLTAAAILGGILPAATGWAVGFFAALGLVAQRATRATQ